MLNHAIHMAAVTRIRFDTAGRVYYDKKLTEGKTKKEALRALKRRVSNTGASKTSRVRDRGTLRNVSVAFGAGLTS